MKSKRAAAASEDVKPVDVPQDLSEKKRKRSDDDAEPGNEVRKSKKPKSKEDKKKKKEKKEKEKKEKAEKKPKKDKSKYNNKTRKEKKEERKDIQDLPEGMDIDDDEVNSKPKKEEPKSESKTDGKTEAKKEEKKDKKEKKDKREKSSKKESKKEKSSSSNDVPQSGDVIDLDSSSAQKAGRNIVFVGNLPYTATAASITAHFATLKPVAVRCLTKKEDPKVCRGIAFVEFATPTHQRTCLDKFHHSMFEDGISPARKINVELTAGGGGKSQGRQDKINEKNKKLDENRAKRIEKEKTAKEENQTNGKSSGPSRMDIHPSRLARLPGLGNLFK
ncbi:hypothetical protein J3E69DRAFT_320702 [Trichoderma sp. SZMC 28015]